MRSQEEAKRSPRETQEKVYGAPRLKIQVPGRDPQKRLEKRVLERLREAQEKPRGGQEDPKGAQEEPRGGQENMCQTDIFRHGLQMR